MNIYGTGLVRSVVDDVTSRLPPGWSATLQTRNRGGRGLKLVITAPDGQTSKIFVRTRRQVAPRDVPGLVYSARSGTPIVVIAPFLSPRSRELLEEFGASFADATGNLRIVLDRPALFLERQGAQRDPDRQPRPLKSFKGGSTGRVVRALCDFLPPYGVRTLAEISSTPLGTVSRVVSLAEQEAVLTRDGKKKIIDVDWVALLRRWSNNYEVRVANRVFSFIEPRGLQRIVDKLSQLDDRYAMTGSMAGPGIAPSRLAMVYVDDAMKVARDLDLTPTQAGANVWLLEPFDEVVFERVREPGSRGPTKPDFPIVCAAPSQVVADLMTGPGRAPQEAEALIARMSKDENAWRHRL